MIPLILKFVVDNTCFAKFDGILCRMYPYFIFLVDVYSDPPAGLRSLAVAEDSIIVDRSPPLLGTVNDGSVISLDADYQSSLDMVCVNWEGFSDPESDIASIVWSVGK